MPLLPTLADGATPPEGSTVVQLSNTTTRMLSIGILKGEYMTFAPAADPPAAYVLNADQAGRYTFQLTHQAIYQGWFAAGYLVAYTAPPPPPEGGGEDGGEGEIE
jgi:hypothetical protein